MELTRTTLAWVWGALILLSLFDVAIIFYAAHTKLEALEKHFKRLDSICINRLTWGKGHHGRIFRLAAISALISSKKIQRQEPLSVEEVKRLPKRLKRWAAYPFHIAYFVTGAVVVLWLYGKYTGLLK